MALNPAKENKNVSISLVRIIVISSKNNVACGEMKSHCVRRTIWSQGSCHHVLEDMSPETGENTSEAAAVSAH